VAGGSTRAVHAAIVANTIVGLMKFAGFALTGSGAMLSEGIHSVADVSNQLLLAIGIARSEREPDEDHPYGYGREKFIFAMISAVGIFWFGCGVTAYHGVNSLMHPHPVEDLSLAVGILILSALIESVTLRMAWVAVRDGAKASEMTIRDFIIKGSDPMGVAVLLEDGAAVLGIFLALGGVGMSMWTGDPIWDAIATLMIAALLGLIAIFLVVRNRTVLLGQSMSPKKTSSVVRVLMQDPIVEAVHEVKTTVMGSDVSRFVAEIEFDGEVIAERFLNSQDMDAIFKEVQDRTRLRAFLIQYGDHLIDAVGDEVDRLEDKIRAAAPDVRYVDIESD
jgi:zinc transporter 9